MRDDLMMESITDLKNTNELCKMLLQTPHYKKIGEEGVFAIVETAKSLNINIKTALNGGLYFVRGKVEMSARLMNSLIRSKSHSITRDNKSSKDICILHGRRADNGDTWRAEFTMDEARKASLTGKGPWQTFPEDMLFARALSRLARQLFPDIIGNVYVEGEISLDPNISAQIENVNKVTYIDQVEEAPQIQFVSQPESVPLPLNEVSADQAELLNQLIGDDEELRTAILGFIKSNFKTTKFEEIPKKAYDLIYGRALDKANKMARTI